MLVCFVSCRTTSGKDHDQIVKSAIDLADAYCEAGQYEKALSTYDRALSQVEDYRLSYNRILVLVTMGELEKAQMLCQECFIDNPYILNFKKTQALLLSELGKDSDAAACYLSVLENDPYDTDSRKSLIRLLIETGDLEGAYSHSLILWNQGYKTKEVCQFLYDLHPSEWKNVLSAMS